MRWFSSVVIALAMLGSVVPAYAYRHGSAYYRSSDGSMVHRPTKSNRDYGRITAYCRDGTHSMSHHHRGTCSHHGGVGHWAR